MKDLFKITEKNYPVKLDIRYASANNVCKTPMYKTPFAYLRIEMKEKFEKAIELAAQKGLRLKIFDSLRPLKVQKFMYEKFPGDFVSNPDTGSMPHCRGVALDLTLIDINDEELDMGSDFDEFSELAYHSHTDLNPEALENRKDLLEIMTKAGWDFYDREWWHYQEFDARKFEIIEVDELSAV